MKTNCCLILGMLAATVAVAQVKTNSLPSIPPPIVGAPAASTPMVIQNVAAPAAPKTNAPAKKTVKAKKKTAAAKTAAAKPAKIFTPVTLAPGVATVDADTVNLRGQAGLKGETIGHVKKGEVVTVIAQINLDKHAAGEPAQWAKIALPASMKVWVDAKFIDSTNKVVAVKKLNLRAGPGENYSVLGVVERGTPISEVITKNGWTQIEAPTNAFAFLAANYLKQEAPAVEVAAVPAPAPAPAIEAAPVTTNTVAEAEPMIATPPVTAPLSPQMQESNLLAAMVMSRPTLTNNIAPEISTNAPEVETNLPPRIVTHEGWVRKSVSLVAPTSYELYSPATDRAINYLYATTTNLSLTRYNGLQIVVTGEEGMEARWRDTPVIKIQKIYVLSTNAPSAQ